LAALTKDLASAVTKDLAWWTWITNVLHWELPCLVDTKLNLANVLADADKNVDLRNTFLKEQDPMKNRFAI
jgi:hypothetical protein